MEDRLHPSTDDHEATVNAPEVRQGRVKRAFEAFRDGENRSWRDILSGNEDDDEESEEERRTEEKRETPREGRGKRLAESLRSLFDSPKAGAEVRDEKDREAVEPMHPFSNFSVLRPLQMDQSEEMPATEVSENETPIDIEENEHEETPPNESLELPSVDPALPETADDTPDPPEPPHPPTAPPHHAPNPPNPPNPPHVVHHHYHNGPPGGNVVNVINAPATHHTETIITRDPRLPRAVAGLLAVDLLDRWTTKGRERKLDKKHDKKHALTNLGLADQSVKQEQLRQKTAVIEANAAAQSKELKRLAEERDRAALKELPIRQGAETVIIAPRTVEDSNITIKEEVVERPPSRPLELPAIERVVHEPGAPQEVLTVVEKAAEQNIAIESLYEKRHESRGAESNADWSGAATSVGVKPTQSYGSPGVAQHTSSSQPTELAYLPPTKQASQQSPLKQAARAGLIMTIILIFIFVFAIILIR